MKKIFGICMASGMAALLLGSCSKQIDDAYLNPNAETVKPIEQLLPGIIDNMTCSYSAAGTNYGTTQDGLYIGKYIQFWVQNSANYQYDAMGGVIGGSDLLGNVWAMHYYGQGQNLNRVVQWGTEQEKWDYVGVAHAIRAWSWLTLTNTYGEVILKEAYNTNLRVFKYDTQAEVYDEVRRLCHLSLEFLNRTDGNVSQANLAIGDQYMNNGDVNKWKKFVYGVLARSFNQLSNKADYQPDSVIKYTQLAMTSNAENTYAKFSNAGPTGTYHFWGPMRNNFGSQRQSKFVADLMSGVNEVFNGVADPRAWYILRENPNGTFKGLRPTYGLETAVLPLNDRPNNFWGGLYAVATAPTPDTTRYVFSNGPTFPILTACEMKFVEAEAQYRKGQKALALAAYKEGIRLSLEMLASEFPKSVPEARKITPAMVTSFLADTRVVPADPNALTLSHIMLQKYIALYGYGVYETWTDMRRFHYTDTETSTGLQVYRGFELPPVDRRYVNNSGKIVYRCRPRYNSEYLYNVDELRRIGALDLDYHTKEMWFTQP